MASELEKLISRLDRLNEELEPESVKQNRLAKEATTMAKNSSANDDFSKQKSKVSSLIRDTRHQLKKRSDLMEKVSSKGPSSRGRDNATISQMGAAIRKSIREVYNAITDLEQLLPPQVAETHRDYAFFATRLRIVELARAHAKELEALERGNTTSTSAQNELTSGASPLGSFGVSAFGQPERSGPADPTVSKLEDLDDISDDIARVREREKDIERDIELIAEGVQALRSAAEDIGDIVTQQNRMIEQVDAKAEQANLRLQTLNGRMNDTVKGMMKGDKFIVTFILVAVLLALIAFMSSYF
ncbi:hypothetical protein H696_01506 [Fonticula alba]|uniref:t-SNARE coiled-coil homology domain-containing protein n=1 Tax=Fonticula alba TaxID=691883 RepID=A0A058ZCJ2_FONAL|nr:hypothetical protein H696_01506 [Fonticula alba]KCV72099.1 hypothetical protein H696_01506 [Fonticula alba]|eukprot:XP_009493677.1 hypothetical protein H696_01506 [Fonticula alba]